MVLKDVEPGLAQEIEARDWLFAVAYDSGDMASLARLYSPDARLLSPDGRVVHGQMGVAAVFRGARKAGFHRVKLETQEVVPLGDDAACEIGHAALIPDHGAPTNLKHAVVWRREEGEWRLLVDTWDGQPT